MIRSPIDQALIVQGGPGTGKTAVALHRAAYLLFEHRGRLARDGVLVVGPNRAFLDYIANVLPSLGERAVRQCTALDLCLPKVEIGAADDQATARWKGSADRLDDLVAVALAPIASPGRRHRGPDRSPHGRVHAGRGGDLARHRQAGSRADQPTSRAAPGARPPGAPPPHRLGRGVVAGGAVEGGVEQGLADPATGAAGRPDAPRSERQASRLDGRRPVPRRRGQHVAQRHTVHLRPRHRRRGAGPLGGGAPRDRPPQPVGLDDVGRRRRPVDHAGRPGELARRVRQPRRARFRSRFDPQRRRRRGQWLGRRAHDRLSGARADPRDRQPVAAAHRCRRGGQPERARRGCAAGVAHRVTRRARDVDRRRRGSGQAPAPVDRRRRRARRARGDHGRVGVDRPRSPSTTSIN